MTSKEKANEIKCRLDAAEKLMETNPRVGVEELKALYEEIREIICE